MADRLLHRKMPATWWLKKRAYTVFMLREFSAIFVAIVAVATVLQVRAIKDGAAAYESFTGMLDSPAVIVFGAVALAFASLHSFTFFQAVGKVLVIWVGDKRVPESLVMWAHFAAWAGLSLLVAWVVL